MPSQLNLMRNPSIVPLDVFAHSIIILVYWFYCNKLYSQPYQLLSKGLPDLQMMFVLSVTLYEKLKFYTNKKILQIELK